MRRFVLILMLGLPTTLFAQKRIGKVSNDVEVSGFGKDSLRFDFRHGEIPEVTLRVQMTRPGRHWPKALALAGTPLLATNKPQENTQLNRKAPLVNFGILGTLSLPNLFKHKPRVFVEVKRYTLSGTLLDTKQIPTRGETLHYLAPKVAAQDAYLIVSISNQESRNVSVASYSISSTKPTTLRETNPGEGGNDPEPESDAPIAWENYLDGVTINGTGTYSSNNFMATYEAAFGPSETWIAVGASSSPGSGSGGGESPYEPPTAEAKAIARDLKKYEANECEARYVIDHLTDMPLMGPLLSTYKDKVEKYMDDNDMSQANANGTSDQNAFKHALVSAYNYCAIGAQHAEAIANFHEVCNGVNTNSSDLEWFMDDYNNYEGFAIAQAANCDHQKILNEIWQAYNEGLLHDINGNPTTGNNP